MHDRLWRKRGTACARACSVGFVLCVVGLASSVRAQPPPGKQTDMELDPDAKPAEPQKTEALPPAEAGAWGVGGKEEEGKFGPGGHVGKPDEKTPDAGKEAGGELGPPGAGTVDAV